MNLGRITNKHDVLNQFQIHNIIKMHGFSNDVTN